MAEFKHGFKAWCEKMAVGFRRDLSLEAHAALDPRALAKHLGIVIITPERLTELGELAQDHSDQLLRHDSSSWSAVTLVLPTQKLIVPNTAHSAMRQNSDIMHEMAHLILEHKPARVDLTSEGLMVLDTYDRVQEDEANWLAGALLVPRDALLSLLSQNPQDAHAASHFKVSGEMIKWRRQMTGIDKQFKRSRAAGR